MAGNPNPTGGKPDKLIRDALKAAIRQSPEKLKKAAEKVLDEAADGSIAHMQFMADRIDGKVAQPIAGDDENPLTFIQRIERVVLDPNHASNKDS